MKLYHKVGFYATIIKRKKNCLKGKRMTIEKNIEKVYYKEYNEIADSTVKQLMIAIHKAKIESLYITKDKFPIYLFESVDFLDVLLNNELNKKIADYIKDHPKKVFTLDYNTNLIDAYYYMRSNNLKKVAVTKNNQLIGEISFKTISSQIANIIIKDPLTGVFNEKYFEIMVEEYQDFHKSIGIIFIDIKNIQILEGVFGEEKVNQLLKAIAKRLKSLLRDIDLVFRNNHRFKLIIFNNLEVTKKVVERIKNALDQFEIEGMKINYSLAYSHVPELQDNILLAIDEVESKLID
jgi:diguanylate cyclase (GGDEF)-like protein